MTVLDIIGTERLQHSVSLSHYGKFEHVLAVDISRRARRRKRKRGGNRAEISFYESDLFQNVPAQWRGQLDAIVSNPPYIPKEDIAGLMTEVKDFEPINALDGGADGLDFYRAIAAESRAWLKADGWLFLKSAMTKEQPCARFWQTHIIRKSASDRICRTDRVAFGDIQERRRGHKNVRPFGGNRNEI